MARRCPSSSPCPRPLRTQVARLRASLLPVEEGPLAAPGRGPLGLALKADALTSWLNLWFSGPAGVPVPPPPVTPPSPSESQGTAGRGPGAPGGPGGCIPCSNRPSAKDLPVSLMFSSEPFSARFMSWL